MRSRDITDVPASLATEPPSPQHRKAALAVVAILVVAFAVTAPFASMPLARSTTFIPTVEVLIFSTTLITAVLLFGQFSIVRTRALLVLASGYLFVGFMALAHVHAFPGGFSAAGLFGGRQTPAWIFHFWHFGFPAFVAAYAILKHAPHSKAKFQSSVPSAIALSIILVVILAGGLTLLAAEADRVLPTAFLDDVHRTRLTFYYAISMSATSALALLVLWFRRSSILDLWLLVALVSQITEPILNGLLSMSRFTLGFYAGRVFSLIAATVMLAVLISEITNLYARLSRANMLLQRERNSKLMSMEAMTASLAHEVRQPLAAIAANSDAALLLLDRPMPDLKEAREALNAIVQSGQNASQVFKDIRNLFRPKKQEANPIDVNAIIRMTLQLSRGELTEHGVRTYTELAPTLPAVIGHEGQLREVLLNLIHNAIDAMDTVLDRPKILRVRTELRDRDAIAFSLEDSGAGIDLQKSGDIFDAFVTTKTHGMGLGLAICRMIIEQHGGEISVSNGPKWGTSFKVTLPIASSHLS